MARLLDAVGMTTKGVEQYLRNLPENQRPSKVFAILTSGHENDSRKNSPG